MNSKKLLIVEDQHDARFYYRKILANEGYKVSLAKNGKEAYEMLKTEFYDIVVTDWLMPEMDGIELTQKIRKELPRQPIIIILTAVNSFEAKKRTLFAGADEYVAKPVDKEVLYKVVKNTVHRSHQESVAHQPTAIQTSSRKNFFCVGVAASTGGPSTVATLFEKLGIIKNAAFLIVLHGQVWMLKAFVKSLQMRTKMPVLLGDEDLTIEPGKIYVAPGDKHMIINDNTNTLKLNDDEPINFVKPSADPLFKSIAYSFGDKSLGIVLTGMGRDGSVGAGYISAAGGRVIAQDPADAILPSMPESVIKLKLADIIAPVDSIPAKLISELK